ncbi:tyrosine-type recombinase/integrase [Parabacteroides faecis]|uniref:tyrosine-type recombinase/integrase n=1 Tax=Parabacteroides faecis TaxID=1217282 RepID=UPI0035205D1A
MYTVSVKIKRGISVSGEKRMPLYVQLIYRRETRKIRLPYRVSAGEWISEREEVHTPVGSEGERSEELRGIREHLVRDCRTVRQVVCSMEKKKVFTLDEIVAACKERFTVSNLTKYVEKLIGELFAAGKDQTARHYRSTLNSFLRFRQGSDLRLDELDPVLVKEYESYLFGTGLCANTVSFYLRVLRSILNHAVREGLVEAVPMLFSHVHTRIEKTRKRAVEEKVILELAALQLPSPGLSLSRDLFLFSYYARGMAFVDLAHLRRENIRGGKIVYVRRKTGQELQIQLLPVMKQLLSRYRDASSPYLFPVLKSATPSRKEYESALRLQNKRLKRLGSLVGSDLSTYTARHSWASVALEKGISEELISKGMGHESVKTTRIYIAYRNTSQIDRANEIVILGRNCKSRLPRGVVL